MNRNFIVSTVALGAIALLGALYSTLTEAAPAALAARSGSAAPGAVPVHGATAQSAAQLAPTPPPSVDALLDASTSPETTRLDARRQLYESVDALVQASEFEKARALLDEDQDHYGDDLAPEWRDLEQSYRLIADCLEHPTPKLRVRAEAFTLVSQALSLKPRIVAACAGKRR